MPSTTTYVVEAGFDLLLCGLILQLPLQVLCSPPQKGNFIAHVCDFGKLGIEALLQDGVHFLQKNAAGM